jgi:hypothetical protein
VRLRRGLAGRRRAAAALGGLLLVLAVVAIFGGWRPAPANTGRSATATVVESAPCGPSGARDTVVVVVDGRTWQVPLDGCGNEVGTNLPVELTFPPDGGAPTVHLAGTGVQPASTLSGRLSVLLMTLAGLSGAFLVMHVCSRRSL